MKRGYSGEKKNSPKCIAPLENINGLFENGGKNVNHIFIWRTPDSLGIPAVGWHFGQNLVLGEDRHDQIRNTQMHQEKMIIKLSLETPLLQLYYQRQDRQIHVYNEIL